MTSKTAENIVKDVDTLLGGGQQFILVWIAPAADKEVCGKTVNIMANRVDEGALPDTLEASADVARVEAVLRRAG